MYKSVKKVHYMSKPAKSDNRPCLKLLLTYTCSMHLNNKNMEILLSDPVDLVFDQLNSWGVESCSQVSSYKLLWMKPYAKVSLKV